MTSISPQEIPSFFQFLATMGVGGILAGFAIWMLNKTWKDHSEVIKGFHEVEKGRADMILNIVTANTTQTAVNTEVLKSLHKRLDKDALERS